jgi:hypothetical protein
MNLQSVVVIVLRLMSLDLLLRAATQLTPWLLEMFRLHPHSPFDKSSSPLGALPWLVLAGIIVGAILLWVLARPIARMVTRGVPHDLFVGALSLADCYSIIFMGVGLFYIAGHLAQVLNWTHYLFRAAASTSGNSWKEEVEGYQISEAFIPFIVGVVLFLNGRKWARALARKHTEDAPIKSEGNEGGA